MLPSSLDIWSAAEISTAGLWVQWKGPIGQTLKMRASSSDFGIRLLAKESEAIAWNLLLAREEAEFKGIYCFNALALIQYIALH